MAKLYLEGNDSLLTLNESGTIKQNQLRFTTPTGGTLVQVQVRYSGTKNNNHKK
jgi:hypothetical protein